MRNYQNITSPLLSGLVGLFCLLLPLLSNSQTLITKNFEFTDGVYLTLNALQKNKPDYDWRELKSNLAANPQTYMTQVEYMVEKSTGDTIITDSVFAVCLGGIPFIRLSREAVSKELTTFAGLRVRGRYSFFTYEDVRTKMVPISAYNPINGRPFRTAMVKREEVVQFGKLMNFETGETVDFTQRNFLKIIKDDKELTKSVKELRGEDIISKLFKCLLIYDDRHPIYVRE
ncbi:MAG: hypothetical protein ACI85O_001569 [Saprospiraceae bacterium]